jgi:hypothetical protein
MLLFDEALNLSLLQAHDLQNKCLQEAGYSACMRGTSIARQGNQRNTTLVEHVHLTPITI